jgi:hypothetical protein
VAFCVMIPCSILHGYQYSGGKFCFHLQGHHLLELNSFYRCEKLKFQPPFAFVFATKNRSNCFFVRGSVRGCTSVDMVHDSVALLTHPDAKLY